MVNDSNKRTGNNSNPRPAQQFQPVRIDEGKTSGRPAPKKK